MQVQSKGPERERERLRSSFSRLTNSPDAWLVQLSVLVSCTDSRFRGPHHREDIQHPSA
jgi:hypothetical protein